VSHEIIDLLYFYRSPLGRLTHNLILKKLYELWDYPVTHLTGIGYCDSFLDMYQAQGTYCLGLTPIFMGLYVRSGAENYPTVLIDETSLPLRHESQKNILCTHILEHTSYPEVFLNDVFRCLKPEGEVIFIVANRHSTWARNDNTPFGSGRPYSKKQLTLLLEQAGFIIIDCKASLFFSPNTPLTVPYYAQFLEKIGSVFFGRYCGIHIIRCLKRIYVPPMLVQKNSKINFMKHLPNLIPSTKPFRKKL
jgi:SAM-dependent methyltransferase